jgi:NDP-sugar pyrophosphorylase family protein
MQALLLCAGLGTRLQHLTENTPKALVEVNGKPLIAWNLEKLKKAGFTKVIVNVHHFAQQIQDYLHAEDNFGLDIHISDETELLLNTGGAIKQAMSFIDPSEPLLVHNVDILTDLDLEEMMAAHRSSERVATLAVRTRKTSRYLMFEEESMQLTGWTNITKGETRLSRITTLMVVNYGFSGVHIVDASLFDFFPEEASFSIIDVYLEAARTANVYAFPHEEDVWFDVGKPESIGLAERGMK